LLIFQLWPQVATLQLQTEVGSAMQVELVQNRSKQKPVSPESAISPPAKFGTKAPLSVHVVQTKKLEQAVQISTDEQQQELAPPLPQVTQLAYEPERDSTAGTMPADVQRMILTRISYPRQARRKGWEGRAMFHLAVREQKLTRLDILLSSGYALLDHAAMRGIQDVKRLPLANGLYSLPVEFRLQ